MLDTPPVRCLSSWLITPGVIWRGALHFTEHKVTLSLSKRTFCACFELSVIGLGSKTGQAVQCGVSWVLSFSAIGGVRRGCHASRA